MRTKLLGLFLGTATVVAVALYPSFRTAATVISPVEQTQAIEVVFVLDTTSSMGGLIATAKEKIWSIAATMAQAEQAPEIRMGLVGFRDRGDAYITEVIDLSTDLDSMYTRLMQFAAVGGGDGPESVNAALDSALNRISWSEDAASTYQVMFLVGDAPPHMDYQGERQYPEIVRAAAARGIVVNTIQCGEVQQTTPHWTEIARLGNGRYMQVGQAGDAFAVDTPFDQELAKLSAELDATRLHYGRAEERQTRDQALEEIMATASRAPAATAARRAVYNSTESGRASQFIGDLIDDVESGKVKLEDIPAEHLPDALAEASLDELGKVVSENAARRDELQSRIVELRDERARYIEAEVDKAGGADDSLDRQIFETVVEQAAGAGLTYDSDEGPAY